MKLQRVFTLATSFVLASVFIALAPSASNAQVHATHQPVLKAVGMPRLIGGQYGHAPSIGQRGGGIPVNNTCDAAVIEPLLNGVDVVRTGDNTGATDELGIGVPQVWEAFTITECTDVTISYCGTTPAFLGALTQLYMGCPYTNLARIPAENVSQSLCPDGNYSLSFPQLPPDTYYYAVLGGGGATGPYTITFSGTACTAVPPVNDDCPGAILLTPGVDCVTINADVSGANVSGGSLPGIECNGYTGNASEDVWFSFVATDTEHVISVSGSAGFDAVLDLRDGTCATSNNIACQDNVSAGATEVLTALGLTIGETYYVRVFDWYAGLPLTTTFDICVQGNNGQVCDAGAGTITATPTTVCLEDGSATISAAVNGDATVPAGYTLLHLLTQGIDEVIIDTSSTPTFTVAAVGDYTIHTLVYDSLTLNVGAVEFGVTTTAVVDALLIQGGGDICASLDMVGAPIIVIECVDPCLADAGTITATPMTVCVEDGSATISAEVNGDAVVPTGYTVLHVLTQGIDQVIIDTASTPTFTVTAVGDYTIHTLVYDSLTLDLTGLEFGVTTAAEVDAILVQGGGDICASLDMVGAPIIVIECVAPCLADAGTVTATPMTVCLEDGSATISAEVNGDAVVPAGYTLLYLLTGGINQVIIDTASVPTFAVSAATDYTIHTFVYDSLTLDLSGLEFGITTAAEVDAFLVQGGGDICASLDMVGAPIVVIECTGTCLAEAGTLTADPQTVCLVNGSVTLVAVPNNDSFVPPGYQTVYALASVASVIINGSDNPSFVVNALGTYTIHAFVMDTLTFDLGQVEFGVTTLADVDELLVQGGGTICGGFDLAGATFEVVGCPPANDACTDAIMLNVQVVADCPSAATIGDNTFATQDGVDPSCDLTTAGYADVWYTFNSGTSTAVTISFDPGTMTSWGMVVLDACDGNELFCEAGLTDPVLLTTLPGADYTVRIYTNTQFGEGGVFTLCVSADVATVVCDGGSLSPTEGGSAIIICADDVSDVIEFTTTSTGTASYAYFLTTDDDVIVSQLTGSSIDMNGAAVGSYRIWGVSYDGTLVGGGIGSPFMDLMSTGSCIAFSDDFVTINVEVCTGLDETPERSWSVFPNPAETDITLAWRSDGVALIELLDAGGRIILDQRTSMVAGAAHTVSLPTGLAAGVYTVRVSSANERAAVKLMVR